MRDLSRKKCVKKFLIAILFAAFAILALQRTSYGAVDEELTSTTRAYFCAGITRGFTSGDCILLENYNSQGGKKYALIDAGRKVEKTDAQGNSSTEVKEFLKKHGVTVLDFIVFTHTHSDHIGDAETVLDYVDRVNTIYMLEADKAYGGSQSSYEKVISKAIDKNIKVVGVSYASLISSNISPNRSEAFKTKVQSAKQENFEAFNATNTGNTENNEIGFGSSHFKIVNWQLFNAAGEQIFAPNSTSTSCKYVTANGQSTSRDPVSGDNNNSLGIVLRQGNKRAYFAGDINNMDKNVETGRLGDEDRLGPQIGDVDFMKLGHHGHKNSNTLDYLNALKPEHVVITDTVGGVYRPTGEWLDENGVNYLYSTNDEFGVSATITTTEVYLGFETADSMKNINGTKYYIPAGKEYEDYTKVSYELVYDRTQTTNITNDTDGWAKMKRAINNNKEQIEIDEENKKYKLPKLVLILYPDVDYVASSSIEIGEYQKVVLKTSDSITMLRGTELINSPMFDVKGELSLGIQNMVGSITIDGNRTNDVWATESLIKVEEGVLNIYNNVKLCNNMNRVTEMIMQGSKYICISNGSGVQAIAGVINMYGGEITNNRQAVKYTLTLDQSIKKNYEFKTYGAGVYLQDSSILNMYGGKISKNIAENKSTVVSNSEYSEQGATDKAAIAQGCYGVGVSSMKNSKIRLYGGEISENRAINNSVFKLTTPTNSSKETNIYTLSNGIFGTGIFASASEVDIKEGFKVAGNISDLNSSIELQKRTWIKGWANCLVKGEPITCKESTVYIDGADIQQGTINYNQTMVNQGGIGANKNGSINTKSSGIDIEGNTEFEIENLNLSNFNNAIGGALYIADSEGTITGGTIGNNTGESGAGIYISKSKIEFNGGNLLNNIATGKGGAIYSTGSNLKFKGTTISGNKGSEGGGIYVSVSASDTEINNVTITNNKATTGIGGGIKLSGPLTMTGGSITGNTAATKGGGINYESGSLIYNSGTIENNIAGVEGNETYPESNLGRIWTIESTEYSIDTDQNMISAIQPGTTALEFKENIESNMQYQIVNKDGEEIAEDELLKTGDKIIVEGQNEYIIVVRGDVDGDGKVGIMDLFKINGHRLNKKLLTGANLKAAYVTDDDQINIEDILRINRYRLDQSEEKIL